MSHTLRIRVRVALGTVLVSSGAAAQAGPTVPGAGAAGPAPVPGSTYVPMPGAASGGQQVGGFGSPQGSNGTIGGGNATESSAHPVTGDEEDSFDIGNGAAGSYPGGVVRGDETGPIYLGSGNRTRVSGGEVPSSHTVRRGDTLWGICDNYFQNPYQWPRIWSYNAQIKNPNWIYPGDEVRLRQATDGGGGGANEAAASPSGSPSGNGGTPGMNLVDRRRQVPNDTVFLRDQGWIHDANDDVWGDITGAAEDKMFLSNFDQVYLHIDKGHDVKVGEELTVFRPLRTAKAGAIVQINGTVRINQWNPKDRVARAQIVESLNVIERGAKIGPVARSFVVVPPRRNDADVQAKVLASVHPQEFWGQNHVVFIDKGEDAGLKVGNRMFIIRRGDAWRRSLVAPIAGYRVSPDDEKPMPPMEETPGSHKDEQNYPEEVVGELRVVSLKKDTATCVVTQARSEIEAGDVAVARKGY
jgi:hypothetical protein